MGLGVYRIGAIIIASVFAIVALGCTIGWAVNRDHNNTLKNGICKITAHPPVIYETCSRKVCTGPDDEGTCVIQTYICYTAYVSVTVLDGFEGTNTIISSKDIQVALRLSLYNLAKSAQDAYPIEAKISCLYQVNGNMIPTGHLQFSENPEEYVFIAGMIFWTLTGFTLIVWAIIELIIWATEHRFK
jgi:hypothetical protein